MKVEMNFTEMLFNRDERLLDCITNLQEKNKRLKEELLQEKKDFKETNDYCFELKDYKSRNEKAIRYIERCRDYHRDIHKEERIFPDEITSLLMILNGGDEE